MERTVFIHPTVHHHRRLRATSWYFTCASSPRVDLDHLRHSVAKSSALIQINLENPGDAKSFGCKIRQGTPPWLSQGRRLPPSTCRGSSRGPDRPTCSSSSWACFWLCSPS